jgi:hypothetical protein
MHIPYEKKLHHKADFRVKYRFYSTEEGGRKTLPFQGYRSDFWYEHPEHSRTNQIFMIWPEFEDEKGNLILTDTVPVQQTGTAKMWILVPEGRNYHKSKIKVGLAGYFMEGSRRVAECEVIEIVDLLSNPTENKYYANR